MELVASRLEHHVQNTARKTARLGGVTGGLHLEFFHRFHVRPCLRRPAPRVLVVEPINNEVGVIRPRAVDGHRRSRTTLGVWQYSGRQKSEVGEVAAVQRDLDHLPANYDLTL